MAGILVVREPIRLSLFQARSGAAMLSLSQGPPDVGLRNPELPSNGRGLDASLEGSTHGVQLSLRQAASNFFDGRPADLSALPRPAV